MKKTKYLLAVLVTVFAVIAPTTSLAANNSSDVTVISIDDSQMVVDKSEVVVSNDKTNRLPKGSGSGSKEMEPNDGFWYYLWRRVFN